MDIAALSMFMSQQNISQAVGVAMLDKSLDMAETVSSDVISMISSASPLELSVNPAVGGNIDIRL